MAARLVTGGRVRFVDLAAQHDEVADEIESGFADVLARTAFIGGDIVRAFEEAYAAFAGVAHCVGVGNGTDAIELLLRALDIGFGDDVVVPANSFVATAEAVVRSGARPVFADCDADTLLLSGAALEAAVTHRTAAVIPVHLYGQLAPMDPICAIAARNRIAVVEDAAQAHGASQCGRPPGAFGAGAATSFYPGKNLGAYGDAGAVLTDDERIATRVRLLADHGSRSKYEHVVFGCNSRLDALQAVVLRAKLRRLQAWNDARAAAADRYDELLDGIDGVRLPCRAAGNVHVWHVYVIRVPSEQRLEVLTALAAEGVEAGIHYPTPIHLQPAFQCTAGTRPDCPNAEQAARELVSLPMHPHLTVEDQARVAQAVRDGLR